MLVRRGSPRSSPPRSRGRATTGKEEASKNYFEEFLGGLAPKIGRSSRTPPSSPNESIIEHRSLIVEHDPLAFLENTPGAELVPRVLRANVPPHPVHISYWIGPEFEGLDDEACEEIVRRVVMALEKLAAVLDRTLTSYEQLMKHLIKKQSKGAEAIQVRLAAQAYRLQMELEALRAKEDEVKTKLDECSRQTHAAKTVLTEAMNAAGEEEVCTKQERQLKDARSRREDTFLELKRCFETRHQCISLLGFVCEIQNEYRKDMLLQDHKLLSRLVQDVLFSSIFGREEQTKQALLLQNRMEYYGRYQECLLHKDKVERASRAVRQRVACVVSSTYC